MSTHKIDGAPGARGGILEPPGICEVKFRAADQKSKMHQLDPVLVSLDADMLLSRKAMNAEALSLGSMLPLAGAAVFADVQLEWAAPTRLLQVDCL